MKFRLFADNTNILCKHDNYFLHIRPLSAAGSVSGRHMYVFSRHRKLDFYKIISFISGLSVYKNFDDLQQNKK